MTSSVSGGSAVLPGPPDGGLMEGEAGTAAGEGKERLCEVIKR